MGKLRGGISEVSGDPSVYEYIPGDDFQHCFSGSGLFSGRLCVREDEISGKESFISAFLEHDDDPDAASSGAAL